MPMISRRAVALGLVVGTAIGQRAWAQTARSGKAKSPPRLGLLVGVYKDAFLEGLRAAGYVEGDNVLIESRPFRPPEALSRSLAELIALKVDVIVASGSQAVRAAQQATRTIPIVMTGSSDPVGTGFAVSLARPDRKSTRLNSSHLGISYAVFCLKK